MGIRETIADHVPDFSRFEKVLRRQGEPDRVPFFELYSNIEDTVRERFGIEGPAPDEDQLPQEERERRAWQRHIDYMVALGYDYCNGGGGGFWFAIPQGRKASPADGGRTFLQGDTHAIATRADFEAFPWPDIAAADYTPLDRMSQLLPGKMKIIAGYSGVLENVTWLLGYEGLSLLLYDDEELVRDMFDAVGSRVSEYMGRCAACPGVGAMVMGDDIGFKTQTMISPTMLRRYLFPWHKKLVDAVHAQGKPAILHACGNRAQVMDDIIGCGWDAIHSFEDQIEPVWDAKARWGDRIAVLGGFDMNSLCLMSPDQVRAHTRTLIAKCAPGGGWALGTGNSVANYLPTDNFLAMIEEGYARGVYGG